MDNTKSVCNLIKIIVHISRTINNFEKIGIFIEGCNDKPMTSVGCNLYGAMSLAFHEILNIVNMKNHNFDNEEIDAIILSIVNDLCEQEDFSDDTILEKLHQNAIKM